MLLVVSKVVEKTVIQNKRAISKLYCPPHFQKGENIFYFPEMGAPMVFRKAVVFDYTSGTVKMGLKWAENQ